MSNNLDTFMDKFQLTKTDGTIDEWINTAPTQAKENARIGIVLAVLAIGAVGIVGGLILSFMWVVDNNPMVLVAVAVGILLSFLVWACRGSKSET